MELWRRKREWEGRKEEQQGGLGEERGKEGRRKKKNNAVNFRYYPFRLPLLSPAIRSFRPSTTPTHPLLHDNIVGIVMIIYGYCDDNIVL